MENTIGTECAMCGNLIPGGPSEMEPLVFSGKSYLICAMCAYGLADRLNKKPLTVENQIEMRDMVQFMIDMPRIEKINDEDIMEE